MELTLCDRISLFLMLYVGSFLSMIVFAFLKPWVKVYEFIVYLLKTESTPEKHAKGVKYVQKQVMDWNASGRKTKMCTGRKPWANLSIRIPLYKKWMTGIHVDLADIVKIDTQKMTVTLEPLLTMGELTAKLIPMGWTIPVVPELNDLTIGGLVAGAGLETSSHKYGLIHNICVSYEIVLASGEALHVTKESNEDLFHAIPGSCGTLGFLTAIEVRIIPAKKYVKLEYIPAHSTDEIMSIFESQTFRDSGNEFVEGIMYSLDKGVIMVGEMTNEAELEKINSVCRWYKPWFYKHVETFLKKDASKEFIEYIPLRQYYHRHTQGFFWEVSYILPFAQNIVFRYLLGWTLPLSVSNVKLFTPYSMKKIFDKNHVTQDFIVPIEKLKESLLLAHDEMEVYPIWLCPAKVINVPSPARFLGDGDEMYVDFGVYGMTRKKEYELVKSARRLELYCIDIRGYQSLYSDVCLTREEFGQMFDPTLYYRVRKELNCEDAFPDIYDKICREVRK